VNRAPVVAGALALAFPAAAFAEDTPPAAEAPLQFDAVYTGEVWRSEGGVADGWRYLDNLDLTLAADLDAAAGIPDTRALAYVLYNNGASLSELTGDALTASNIETGVRALRLYEAWVEHDFRPGVSLRLGLYDLNSEFDSLEASQMFVGSAQGVGPDLSQSGENGPSIFPVTSLAARLALGLTDRLTVRAAVLDAVPGDPAHPARTAIELGDGALTIAEADGRIGFARLVLGGWRYSRRFARLDGSGFAHSQGAYLRGEACLARPSNCRLQGFFRVGLASPAVNPFGFFGSAGLTFALNPRARMGLALAHADAGGGAWRDPAVPRDETSLELTLAYTIYPRIVLQPNLQLLSTGGEGRGRSAAVIGLRAVLELF
jgi:porin